MAQLVGGADLERAEKMVCVLFETGTWPDSALEHWKIAPEGLKAFIGTQVGVLRDMYKDIDSRHEAAIATMFTHCFFTGFAAGRGQGYSADEGM